jgi:hypothetical protein
MTSYGNQARVVPVEALAFMRIAEQLARPAPTLLLLVEELEALPDLDPRLPMLAFTLFDDLPEVPRQSPARPGGTRPHNPATGVHWPAADHATRLPFPGFSGRATERPALAPSGPGDSDSPPSASPWRNDPRNGRPFAQLAAHDGLESPLPRTGGDEERRHAAPVPGPLETFAPSASEPEDVTDRVEARHRWTPLLPENEDRFHEPERSLSREMPGRDIREPMQTASPHQREPNGSLAPGDDPASTFAWEALALVDALATDLLIQRPASPVRTHHSMTRPPRHLPPAFSLPPPASRFLSSDPRPQNSDPESDDTPSLEPEDLAAMVADVLFEQARRHGVDLS